eukprot:gene11098-9683_t
MSRGAMPVAQHAAYMFAKSLFDRKEYRRHLPPALPPGAIIATHHSQAMPSAVTVGHLGRAPGPSARRTTCPPLAVAAAAAAALPSAIQLACLATPARPASPRAIPPTAAQAPPHLPPTQVWAMGVHLGTPQQPRAVHPALASCPPPPCPPSPLHLLPAPHMYP